jgi:hypothetical protein
MVIVIVIVTKRIRVGNGFYWPINTLFYNCLQIIKIFNSPLDRSCLDPLVFCRHRPRCDVAGSVVTNSRKRSVTSDPDSEQSTAVICCWPSPSQSIMLSGSVGTPDDIFVLSKAIYVF